MARYSRKQLVHLILSQPSTARRSEAVQAVAGYLVTSRRSNELISLIRELEYAAQLSHSHTMAHLSSVHRLSDKELADIASRLTELTGSHTVELSTTVDPELLGGLYIKLPDTEADFSLRGRLRRMTAKETIV